MRACGARDALGGDAAAHGRTDSANPLSIVCVRSLLCSVLRWTPSFFDACVTFPRLADIAATMYFPSNASTACSSVIRCRSTRE